MYKRAIFGKAKTRKIAGLKDIRGFELVAFIILAVFVLLMGVYPQPFIEYMNQSVSHTLALASMTKL